MAVQNQHPLEMLLNSVTFGQSSYEKSSKGKSKTTSTSKSTTGGGNQHNVDKSSYKLRGYRPPENRPKYKVFFVSGVMVEDGDVDYTVENVKGHMETNGCQVKYVRKVKYSRYMVSLKVVVYEDSAPFLLDSMFWPDGIQCRPWLD